MDARGPPGGPLGRARERGRTDGAGLRSRDRADLRARAQEHERGRESLRGLGRGGRRAPARQPRGLPRGDASLDPRPPDPESLQPRVGRARGDPRVRLARAVRHPRRARPRRRHPRHPRRRPDVHRSPRPGSAGAGGAAARPRLVVVRQRRRRRSPLRVAPTRAGRPTAGGALRGGVGRPAHAPRRCLGHRERDRLPRDRLPLHVRRLPARSRGGRRQRLRAPGAHDRQRHRRHPRLVRDAPLRRQRTGHGGGQRGIPLLGAARGGRPPGVPLQRPPGYARGRAPGSGRRHLDGLRRGVRRRGVGMGAPPRLRGAHPFRRGRVRPQRGWRARPLPRDEGDRCRSAVSRRGGGARAAARRSAELGERAGRQGRAHARSARAGTRHGRLRPGPPGDPPGALGARRAALGSLPLPGGRPLPLGRRGRLRRTRDAGAQPVCGRGGTSRHRV